MIRLTYHVYNSNGRETIFIKVFNHAISQVDSVNFLKEPIAASLQNS